MLEVVIFMMLYDIKLLFLPSRVGFCSVVSYDFLVSVISVLGLAAYFIVFI